MNKIETNEFKKKKTELNSVTRLIDLVNKQIEIINMNKWYETIKKINNI